MSKKRLNAIVAFERDIKARAYKDLSKEHHLLLKPDSVFGFSKTYQPKDEDGEQFPAESKLVQVRVPEAMKQLFGSEMQELFDATYTKDTGNRYAVANIVLDDGTVLAEDVPVPTLLFLEKQLSDLHTFVEKLPTLDPAEAWTFDTAKGYYVTPPVQTIKTKKVKKAIVLYPHSDKHPAQTQLIDDDVVVGTWTAIKHSGAVPDDQRRGLVRRVSMLQKAVKEARERANMHEVDERKIGAKLFSFIMG
jgi:hypothetical protein